jgi:tetrahydromethanopterin S-methyltransferase subunit F
MEQKKSPSKSALQYGVLFGILMVLEFVILYVMDIDPITNPSAGIVINTMNYLVFPVSIITIGCLNYKKKLNEGFISFGECLKIGVTICLIAGLIYGIFSVVFNMIFPEFMEEILKKTKQVMLQQNPTLTTAQLDMAMSMTKKFMSPALMVPVTIAMYSFIGLIYSLIIGAFVKNDNPQSF